MPNPIVRDTPVVRPAIPAQAAKTYPHQWAEEIVIQWRKDEDGNTVLGRVLLGMRPYDSTTGGVDTKSPREEYVIEDLVDAITDANYPDIALAFDPLIDGIISLLDRKEAQAE